jgi:UPF0176 protein
MSSEVDTSTNSINELALPVSASSISGGKRKSAASSSSSSMVVATDKNENKPENGPVKIAALYKFVDIEDPVQLQSQLRDLTTKHHILGMLILATEGLNGTIAASPHNMDTFLQEFMSKDTRFQHGLEIKFSINETQPFYRMRISIRKEIVTLGVENFKITPSEHIHNIEPKDWNSIIQRDDLVVIDTRNDYEYDLGTFQKAINPNTVSFRDFPQYMDEHILSDPTKSKKVAMFCTGGIRCEKVSSYLIQQGFEEIYNLKGGILKYLEEIPQNQSIWEGECFVFDQRVTVGHGLIPGNCQLCRGCRHPVTKEDRERDDFQEGINCRYCIDKLTEEKKRKAIERDLQMKLAKERQEKHLGYKHPSHKIKKGLKKQQQQQQQQHQPVHGLVTDQQGDEKKQKLEHSDEVVAVEQDEQIFH